MRLRRILVVISVLILSEVLTLVSIYAIFAVRARRLLPIRDVGHFVWTWAIASVVHADTAGGERSFAIISEAISEQAVTQASVKVESKSVTLPLPPYTIRASCDLIIKGLPKELDPKLPGPKAPPSCKTAASFPTESQYFLTLTSGGDFYQQYLEKTLPEAGWVKSDRLGGAVFYIKKGHTRRMMIAVGSYLTANIIGFTIKELDGPNIGDILLVVPQSP